MMNRKLFYISLCLLSLLCACKKPDNTILGNTSMQVVAPYQEPCLVWTDDYKTVLNKMRDRGFVADQVSAQQVSYNYYSQGLLTETASLRWDEEKNYVGASVEVLNYTVTPEYVRQWLGQNYTFVTSTTNPSLEYFYRSKVLTDSILISMQMHDGHPAIYYQKGSN